jgi:hypothetical protein
MADLILWFVDDIILTEILFALLLERGLCGRIEDGCNFSDRD